MTGHCTTHRVSHSWTRLFRRHNNKYKRTADKRIVIEPQIQDNLLDSEFENLSEKLSSMSISQDFISEMREAFHLFDKV